jgi:hypothetical protein
MIWRPLTFLLCWGLSIYAGATTPRDLANLKDALPANRFAIEVIIFLRTPTDDAFMEPLQKEPQPLWPLDLMALPTQGIQQRAQHSNQFSAATLNSHYCRGDADALLPDFMKIVLTNGFETELLNEFSPAGSQITLTPPLTAAEANPLSVDPIDVYEPEPNPEAVAAVTIPPISSAEDDFMRALHQFNDDVDSNSWQWLTDERLTLEEQRRNIALAPELNVVFHGRWQQPVPPRDAPQRILLPVQNLQLSTQFMRLNGHIGITLGRYLHANTKLWLQPDPSSNQYALLHESRRMRSGELHYIDHPMMGVLINIEPIKANPVLESSWRVLQEAETLTSAQ